MSMDGLAKLLFDFNKLPSNLMLIIFILSGTILFVPPEFLARIQLSNFNQSYGHWVGIAFISSVSFLTVSLFTTIKNKIARRHQDKGHEESIRNSLQRLDPFEQSILREFFIVSSTTNLPMDHASVVGLQDKGIIRLAQTQTGSYFMNGFDMPCTLTGYARSVIEKKPSLIGLNFDGRNMTEDNREWLRNNRPPWTKSRF